MLVIKLFKPKKVEMGDCSRKNPSRGVKDIEFSGVLKIQHAKIPEVNYKRWVFSRGDQEKVM